MGEKTQEQLKLEKQREKGAKEAEWPMTEPETSGSTLGNLFLKVGFTECLKASPETTVLSLGAITGKRINGITRSWGSRLVISLGESMAQGLLYLIRKPLN